MTSANINSIIPTPQMGGVLDRIMREEDLVRELGSSGGDKDALRAAIDQSLAK